MPKAFAKHDFLIKDLAVSIGAAARGGTWMPADDQPTPPTPISPVAAVLANGAHIEAVRGAVEEAVKAKRFDDIARAFVAGDDGGHPALRAAIQQIGSAVVASAAFAGLGGSVGYPNPDCGGTSLETIPPTLTPVVHVGIQVHRVSELPRLKAQLAKTLDYLEKAGAAAAPRGAEVATVRGALEAATQALR